jgi:hypothetical protein
VRHCAHGHEVWLPLATRLGLYWSCDVAVKSDVKKPATTPEAAPAAETSAHGKSEDVALVYGVSDDGHGLDIIRKREGRLEAGTVRPLEQGKPIHGEVVRLKPRQNSPLVCDVEVDVPAPTSTATRSEARSTSQGPAQVATEKYRKNWDAIYKGRASKSDKLLN